MDTVDKHFPPLRLTIELVPEPCWYANLRDVLSRATWDKLRREVYRLSGHRCGICGAGGRLHCHEVWRYDDAAHIQRLGGFRALCVLCHHVKHIGLAGKLASEGKLDYEAVIAHFMRVNGCSRADFQRHYEAAFAQWRERSRYAWQTDLGDYTPLARPDAAR
ncbi:MAG TPA: HNH endonuclease [Ktedonobacterales bacterium]|nr:HNH endonuclease [Ktedonobacterales bacterium]